MLSAWLPILSALFLRTLALTLAAHSVYSIVRLATKLPRGVWVSKGIIKANIKLYISLGIFYYFPTDGLLEYAKWLILFDPKLHDYSLILELLLMGLS